MDALSHKIINDVLASRRWRYATKRFDPTKKVSEEDLETLLEAIRLSASSFGLQPYHVFVITDQSMKEKLRKVSWNQPQVTGASHVLVFAHLIDFGEELVDDYLQNVSAIRNTPAEGLKAYGDIMKSTLLPLPPKAKSHWAAKQAYLAFGNAMQAAAELKIDTCPMEGFQPEAYNDILALNDKNLNASVVLTIGYRSQDDKNQHLAKVRKPVEVLFTHI